MHTIYINIRCSAMVVEPQVVLWSGSRKDLRNRTRVRHKVPLTNWISLGVKRTVMYVNVLKLPVG